MDNFTTKPQEATHTSASSSLACSSAASITENPGQPVTDQIVAVSCPNPTVSQDTNSTRAPVISGSATNIPCDLTSNETEMINKLINIKNGTPYSNEFYDTKLYKQKVVYLIQKDEHIKLNIAKIGSTQAWMGRNGRHHGYKGNIRIYAMLPAYDHKKIENIIRELFKIRFTKSDIGFDHFIGDIEEMIPFFCNITFYVNSQIKPQPIPKPTDIFLDWLKKRTIASKSNLHTIDMYNDFCSFYQKLGQTPLQQRDFVKGIALHKEIKRNVWANGSNKSGVEKLALIS